MQMHEAVELVEADSVDEADTLLDAGWTLLAVTSGHRTKGEIGPIYVLGKRAQVEPLQAEPGDQPGMTTDYDPFENS